jgi:hypothetical protein
MQLADHVEREGNRQRPRRHPPIRSCAAVTGLDSYPVSTSHALPLCDFTQRSLSPNSQQPTALPMTPHIYYQRQPCLTNNSQAFTQCGHACNLTGSGKTRSR